MAPFTQSDNWRASFSPKETYWWWFLKAPTTPWSNRLDYLWSATSVTLLTISLGLMGDIAPRFLTGGPNSFGAFTVSAQSVLTLLVAGGALTKAGQEALKSFLKEAIDSVQGLEDMEDWTLAQYSLGQIYAAINYPKQALEYYSQARVGYIFLGDLGHADALQRRIERLKKAAVNSANIKN
ncbi:MAG: hypothetical protein RMZ41_030235 [Nostoc sp. DedVER02]|uniref:hypothetical protein n=1 Tax=unclassified Nostoc TaxID=2593658 RepID=UPI002AD36526|nr:MULTISPECIES: hypothetical protein [unclassified Nostoc]MDZ7990563.1 hypothetical protein [Nostoc sp. DedVER02]MDZ8115075.1 hypothetical protein [Nostoc sp. DedVER01b]